MNENSSSETSSAGRLAIAQMNNSYSCKSCGSSFDASPPDSLHESSSVYQCWKFDWVERSYQCGSCGTTTVLYWHPEKHKHRDYATLEEMRREIGKDRSAPRRAYVERMVGY
jgi:hypothetical protein